MDQLTTFPASFTAGDTFDLLVSLADYSAFSGWALSYAVRGYGLSVINLTSAASGDSHLVQQTAVQTALWKAGTYRATAMVTHATLGRVTLGTTTFDILPDPSAITATDDTRSHARKVLDAIQATIEGRAAVDQQEIEVDTGSGRRKLKRCLPDELLKLRAQYRAEVAREESAESGINSGPFGAVPFSFGGGA